MLTKTIHLLLVASLIASGCGGTGSDANPIAPSSTTPHITTDCVNPIQYHSASCPDRTSLTMAIQVQGVTNGADVPWSYTFAGLSISGSTKQWTVVEGLSIGDYDVVGQMTGSAMNFQLSFMNAPHVSGMYKANSIVNVEGSPSQISCNGIFYSLPPGTRPPQQVHFRFSIVDGFTPAPCG